MLLLGNPRCLRSWIAKIAFAAVGCEDKVVALATVGLMKGDLSETFSKRVASKVTAPRLNDDRPTTQTRPGRQYALTL